MRRRDSPLAWAFIAVCCLGTALVVFMTTASAAGRTAFGTAGSVGVLVAALLVTLFGTVTTVDPAAPVLWRWIVTAAVAVGWGGVLLLAGVSLFAAGRSPDLLTGMLLALGAVGMAGILARLVRPAPS
jgi:hypothetical protein